ncbi:MAG: reverse transcriptase domain-containing protein [Thermodesulfobacteriota bacterium]
MSVLDWVLTGIVRIGFWWRRRRERRALGSRGPVSISQVRTVSLEGLDHDRFAPISGEEARDLITKFRSFWRRTPIWYVGRIPNPDLPHIRLIDRGMVAAGLITPEELAEIHRVGLEMDEIRPDKESILDQAQVTATLSITEREVRKLRKKAEAQQRREQRAKAVDERKRTDIVFLGRGVSKDLADRRANVEELQKRGLPVLASPADLARAMELTIPTLRWLAFHSEASPTTHYVNFVVPKKSGGTRTLSAPHKSMAAAQKWILTHILGVVPIHDAAHGFVPGRSIVTNAALHVGKEVVVNLDLKDFFPTVTFPRVKGLFAGMGYSPAVATILALLCTESPRQKVTLDGKPYHVAVGPRALPQGACTSPALSNLVARRLDSRLSGLCRTMEWTYSRYADDLTFSTPGLAGAATDGRGGLGDSASTPTTDGDAAFQVRSASDTDDRASTGSSDEVVPADSPSLREKDSTQGSAGWPSAQVGYLLARVRHIVEDEGFRVNGKKTRVLKRSTAQKVTGVVVNDRPGISHRTIKGLRALLHHAKRSGLPSQNRTGHPHFASWLQGMIAYISMVNGKQGQKLASDYHRARDTRPE